jgi:hypothetical protein
MKPLGELNLNKHSIVAESDKRSKRPALELLNLYTNKIAEENSALQYRKEIDQLKEENAQLRMINSEVAKELEVEKRLRKVWNKEEVVYEDLEGIKRELELMRLRYSHYK